MEGVLQALQRVRNKGGVQPGSAAPQAQGLEMARKISVGSTRSLDRSTLHANKIVSFDSTRDQTRPYDVLRNLTLDDLEEVGSRIVAVTAPTIGCGTTVTAANLAFSISRLRTTKVLLLDCNVPAASGLAQALGMEPFGESEDATDDDLRTAEIDGVSLLVGSLAHLSKKRFGSDEKDSETPLMSLRRELGPATIILDLPPMLTGDRTLPLILRADMVLLVLAVGRSTVADLEACKTYLHETSQVHVVLNKSRMHGL